VSDVDVLEAGVGVLGADVDTLGTDIDVLETDADALQADADTGFPLKRRRKTLSEEVGRYRRKWDASGGVETPAEKLAGVFHVGSP